LAFKDTHITIYCYYLKGKLLENCFILQGDNKTASNDLEAKARDAYDFDYNEVQSDLYKHEQ